MQLSKTSSADTVAFHYIVPRGILNSCLAAVNFHLFSALSAEKSGPFGFFLRFYTPTHAYLTK